MSAVLALLFSKAGAYTAMAAGVVATLFFTRQSGVKAERNAGLQREVADTKAASKIAADVEKVADPRGALDKEFSR